MTMSEQDDAAAVISAMTTLALAGDMMSARIILARRSVTDDVLQAVAAAVVCKALTGDTAALALKARYRIGADD